MFIVNSKLHSKTKLNSSQLLSVRRLSYLIVLSILACISQAMAASLDTTSHLTDSGMYWGEIDRENLPENQSVPHAPFAGAHSLTTPLLGGNNHRGIFFDVIATNEITVCNIDVVALGDTDFEIYYRNGTHVGFESNSAAWTLIGSATNVVRPGIGIPSVLPIPIDTTISVGSNHAFYVTSSNTAIAVEYTDGTAVGNTLASDANLSILEGSGGEYPFLGGGTLFSPRNFNGTVHYDVGSGPTACLTYVAGGNVSGLNGSVTLQNNGADDITLNADGAYAFSGISDGVGYDITVSSQPATQTCTVSNGTGTISGADVTNVDVVCTTNTYTVGGNVTGLSGSVTLQNNGGDDITLNTDGVFTFPAQNDGSAFAVTISSQPATQTCVVTDGSGTLAGADVSNVLIACTTNTFTVGGNVAGLSGSVTLQNNGGDDITLNADGVFTFPAQNDGTAFAVTVSSQPVAQSCSVSNGSGTLAGADVNNVTVSCSANTYTVGGNVSGLSGSVTLQNNGGDDITLNIDGAFTFPAQNDGSVYAVTISSQPATQSCSVSNGSGTLAGADVTNVTVTCSTDTYTVGGNVSGLSGSVTLQNNGGDDITLNADGGFTFPAQNDGTAYAVTVSSQPTTQSCSVTNGSGNLAGADVTNVTVSCSTDTHTVGGSVTGLSGSVTLQNNGGDDVTLNTDGAFTFATALSNTSAYAVTVLTQPVNQSCTVSNDSGSINGADVNDVMVACVSDTPTVMLSTVSLSYTPVIVGQTQNAVINVSNTGTGDLVISGFNLPASPFNVLGGSCINTPVTLLSGESCEIEISFNPTTEGMFNDEISILSNALSSPDVVQLVGNGVTGGVATPVPNFNFWGLALLILLFSTTAYRFRKNV